MHLHYHIKLLLYLFRVCQRSLLNRSWSVTTSVKLILVLYKVYLVHTRLLLWDWQLLWLLINRIERETIVSLQLINWIGIRYWLIYHDWFNQFSLWKWLRKNRFSCLWLLLLWIRNFRIFLSNIHHSTVGLFFNRLFDSLYPTYSLSTSLDHLSLWLFINLLLQLWVAISHKYIHQ